MWWIFIWWRCQYDIFEKLRSILEEGNVDIRIQYIIENLFKIRKNNFKGHESIKEELDLVEDRWWNKNRRRIKWISFWW